MRLLDEVCLSNREVVVAAIDRLAGIVGEGIGAVVEYELFRRTTKLGLPAIVRVAADPIPVAFERLLAGGSKFRGSPTLQAMPFDIVRIPLELRENIEWVAFVQRARASARVAGYNHEVASAVVGAIEELANNVVEHSGSKQPAFAGFAQKGQRFEYVIADCGIGVLASLRECSEFRSLRDDLEALPLAITPGISRMGRGSGRGYGFRAVLAPLRFASGYVRLRSGGAVLEVEGYGAENDRASCSQRPSYDGVIVSAVLEAGKPAEQA